MLRAISAGTGLSYESVANDYERVNYSSSRTSKLEDRRRFRAWQQNILIKQLLKPIRNKFYDVAAIANVKGFPKASELINDHHRTTATEYQTPEWEWVDPQNEQAASQAAIDANMSTLRDELGANGKNWRRIIKQRAIERDYMAQFGIKSESQAKAEEAETSGKTGAMGQMGRRQFQNNRKAIDDVLNELISGAISEAKARVFLNDIGLSEAQVAALIKDASDGTLDEVEATLEQA